MGQKQERIYKTERATGPGRKTREELYKKSGIKPTAMRFQTGGRHQKPPGLHTGNPPPKKNTTKIRKH